MCETSERVRHAEAGVINENDENVRRALRQALGFDTALALHLGRRHSKDPTNLTHRQRAARALAIGARHAPHDIAQNVLHTVNDRESQVGVRHGESEVNQPFVWTLGASGLGLVLFGPVGAAIGGGLGYVLSSGGFFKE